MSRLVEVARDGVTATRQQLVAVSRVSERTLLLGTVLLGSAVSAAVGFVLAQYYSIDVLTSVLMSAKDCWLDWGMQMGTHCFSDYGSVVDEGMRANPWEPYPLFLPWYNYQTQGATYPPPGMLPQLFFGVVGKWLHTPRVGFWGYEVALTSAVFTPAVWAARGASGLERVVVLVTLGAAAIPVWGVIDRGNSVGFVVPIGLVFLVALRRQRWALATIMVVLAAMVKPQFALLGVALFAARQWRMGGLAVAGVVISYLVPFLLWPRDFPETIVQWAHNTLKYGESTIVALAGPYNVSFGKGFFFIPDRVKDPQWGYVSNGFFDTTRSMIGYIVVVLVVALVLALGRRISPVMAGIVLLPTASLFPGIVFNYYLVFALPIAALVARDPDGPPESGIFDRLATLADRRRAVGVCVTIAAVLTIVHIPLPGPPMMSPVAGQLGVVGIVGYTPIVHTTAELVPLAWLIVCAAIIVSYGRRPASDGDADNSIASTLSEPIPAAVSGRDRD